MNGFMKLFLCVGACVSMTLAEEAKAGGVEHDDTAQGDKEGPDSEPIGDDNGDEKEEVEEAEAKIALPEVEQMGALFAKIDTDTDGKMSMPEIIAFWKLTRKSMLLQSNTEDMTLMDKNKDSKVSLEEFIQKEDEEFIKEDAQDARTKAFNELERAKFKLADKNGDGSLDEHELPDAVYGETHDEIVRIMAAHNLKMKDADGDGELDAKEFNELTEDPAVEGEKVEEKDAKVVEEEAESQKEAEEEFKKQDADGNGKLNLEELVHYESGAFHITVDMQHLFAVADVDKDSHITLAEFTEHLNDFEGTPVNEHLNEWIEHHEL